MEIKELFENILSGVKVRYKTWDVNHYIYFENNIFIDESNNKIHRADFNFFIHPENWEIYQEPKSELDELERLIIDKEVLKTELTQECYVENICAFYDINREILKQLKRLEKTIEDKK